MTGQKDLTTRINATTETDIERTGGQDGNRTLSINIFWEDDYFSSVY